MHNISWYELQYVLAVAQEGSLAAAARKLGVNHTTVLRHIAALEESLDTRLFRRLPTGYSLTEEGRILLDTAQSIDHAVVELERRIAGQEMKLEGLIRVTMTDVIYKGILHQHIFAFLRAHPGINIEISTGQNVYDLSALEADIAIRSGSRPGGNMHSQRLMKMKFAIYVSPIYLRSMKNQHDLENADWLGLTPLLQSSVLRERITFQIDPKRIRIMSNSFEAIQIAAEEGQGFAILPRFFGDASERLQRIDDMDIGPAFNELWMVTHKDLYNSAKVRAFMDFMQQAMPLS